MALKINNAHDFGMEVYEELCKKENNYYLSEAYKKECEEKRLGIVCQEYVLEIFKKYIPIFDEYLER